MPSSAALSSPAPDAPIADAPIAERGVGVAAWLVPVLLLTLTVGIVRQGGTSAESPVVLGVGLLMTTGLATIAHGPSTVFRRLGSATVAPILLLGAWAPIDGALHGSAQAGVPLAALAVGVATVLTVIRGFDRADRTLLRDGLVLIGAFVGGLTWVGIVLRLPTWSATGRGLWRADGPLTYANATAAVLVVLGLVALGGLGGLPGSDLMPIGGNLPAAALMFGAAGATLSRGGALALACGSLILVLSAGRAALRPLLFAATGGALIVAGLIPAMPTTATPQTVSAVIGLIAGLLVTHVLDRWSLRHERGAPTDASAARPGRPARAGRLVALRQPGVVVGAFLTAALLLIVSTPGALDALRRGRVNLDATHRDSAAAAAWAALRGHLWTGLGPGASTVHWRDARGASMTLVYLHDEYLQVLLELGILGALLLAWWLLANTVALGRQLQACRRIGVRLPEGAAVAAVAAFAVHSGVDFLWHLPALALTGAALIGLGSADSSASRRGSWQHASSTAPERGTSVAQAGDPAGQGEPRRRRSQS